MYLQREGGSDWICIHDVESEGWPLVQRFPAALNNNSSSGDSGGVRDASDAVWSPDGRCIVVPDAFVRFTAALFAPDGRSLALYDGSKDVVARAMAREERGNITVAPLGIRSLAWSPTSQFLALGGYDDTVRLVNAYTWGATFEFNLGSSSVDPTSQVSNSLLACM